jgi:hypothetical protein
MIPRHELPTISYVLSRIDIPPGRRGRTRCPIHGGDNSEAFSYEDVNGLWYCFRCGIGGDAISLVQKVLDLDFKGALNWLGISGKPPISNPNMALVTYSPRQRYAPWIERQRSLRDEYYTRLRIEAQAVKRLRRDPDSQAGWELLAVAYSRPGLDAIEAELDYLLAYIPREAYPRRRTA